MLDLVNKRTAVEVVLSSNPDESAVMANGTRQLLTAMRPSTTDVRSGMEGVDDVRLMERMEVSWVQEWEGGLIVLS